AVTSLICANKSLKINPIIAENALRAIAADGNCWVVKLRPSNHPVPLKLLMADDGLNKRMMRHDGPLAVSTILIKDIDQPTKSERFRHVLDIPEITFKQKLEG